APAGIPDRAERMRHRLSEPLTTPRASQANAPPERRHTYPARLRAFAGSAPACWHARSILDKSTARAYALLQLVPACARPAPQTFHADTGAADNRARSGST